jgi:hypothetical protein
MIYAFFAAFRFDVETWDQNEHNRAGDIHQYDNEKIETFNKIFLISEGIFFIDFLTQFCLEYSSFDDTAPVRNINLTAKRYANNEMMFDLIPLVPFTLFLRFKYSRLLFIIKTIRIKKSVKLLDTKKFVEIVKEFFDQELQKVCQDDKKENDIVFDNT